MYIEVEWRRKSERYVRLVSGDNILGGVILSNPAEGEDYYGYLYTKVGDITKSDTLEEAKRWVEERLGVKKRPETAV